MNVQKLRPESNKPIVIETPLGLIEIEVIMVGSESPKRSYQIKLPGRMVAHKGRERALSDGKWVRQTPDGKIVPKFSMLVPDYDENGDFTGLKEPGIIRVKK
jgi:hypothetical protein